MNKTFKRISEQVSALWNMWGYYGSGAEVDDLLLTNFESFFGCKNTKNKEELADLIQQEMSRMNNNIILLSDTMEDYEHDADVVIAHKDGAMPIMTTLYDVISEKEIIIVDVINNQIITKIL